MGESSVSERKVPGGLAPARGDAETADQERAGTTTADRTNATPTVGGPEAVILVHGTFAFLTDEEEKGLVARNPTRSETGHNWFLRFWKAKPDSRIVPQEPPPWWSPHGTFRRQIDDALDGRAACWPDEVCAKFPWFAQRRGRPSRYCGRPAFTWSGHNNEQDRREAGARLLDGLATLEKSDPPVPYHLVGHSYGGAVIWNALIEAAHHDVPLPNLRSWTTLGAPFPRYVPKPASSVDRFAAAFVLALFGFVVWFMGFRLSPAVWAEYARNLSPTTIVVLVITLLYLGVVGLDRAYARKLGRRLAREDIHARTAWQRHGACWLGLYSGQDEAIAALRESIGLYVRIPWISGGWRAWIPNVLVVTPLAMPLNYVLRLFTQGGPKFGGVLGEIAPAPLPHNDDRGPLPDAIDQELRSQADADSQRELVSSISKVRERLVKQSAVELAITDALQWIKANVQLEFGLYHNYYYRVDGIQKAIAYHIARHIGPGGSSEAEIESLDSSIGQDLRTWLSKQPGPAACCSSTALERPVRRVDSTPGSARAPYILALAGLVIVCGLSAMADVGQRLVPALSRRLEVEANSAVRSQIVASMLGLSQQGEQALLDLWLQLSVDRSIGGLKYGVYESIFQGLQNLGQPAASLVAARFRDARTSDEARLEILGFLTKMGPKASGELGLLEGLLNDSGMARFFDSGYRTRAQDKTVETLLEVGPRGFQVLEKHADALQDYAGKISIKVSDLRKQSRDGRLSTEAASLLDSFGLSAEGSPDRQ